MIISFRGILKFSGLLWGVLLCAVPVAAAEKQGTVTVVGADDKPVLAEIHFLPWSSQDPESNWYSEFKGKTNTEGRFVLDPEIWTTQTSRVPEKARMMIAAEGYPLAFANLPSLTEDSTVTLKKGKAIDFLILDATGKAVEGTSVSLVAKKQFPFGKPRYFHIRTGKGRVDERFSQGGFSYGVPTYLPEPGHVRFYIDEKETTFPLGVLVSKQGTLMNWLCPEVFSAQELSDKPVEVRLPGSASLRVNIKGGKGISETTTVTLFAIHGIPKWSDINLGEINVSNAEDGETTLPASVLYPDLPSGKYGCHVLVNDEDSASTFAQVFLEPGDVKELNMTVEKAVPEDFKGDDTLVIQILSSTGKPIAGKEFKVLGRRFQPHCAVDLTTVTTDVNGQAIISGINVTGKQFRYALYEGPKMFWSSSDIRLEANPTKTSQTLTLRLRPGIGEVVPDFEAIDIMTSKTVKLSDLRGKYVYMDFWATWCGPCQGSMREANILAKENCAKWGDKAVVLGLSIDDDLETVTTHIKKNGWTNLPQWWGGPDGYKCKPVKIFQINGVPSGMTIDPEGKFLGRHYSPEKFFEEHGIK